MLVYGIELSGCQGSGKTTTLNMLREWAESNNVHFYGVKFASTLYEMHDAVKAIAKSKGIPMKEKDGGFLQWLGTDWGRKNFGDGVWVNATKTEVGNIIAQNVLKDQDGKRKIMVVIDDCRFPNELDAFKDDFLTVRLTADRDVRKARADSWRDTENHPSEIALDGMEKKFDLVLDTVALGKDKVLGAILDMMVLRERKV